MKKLIIAICVATTLVACSQSAGDKFVGNWTGAEACKDKDYKCDYSILDISKNNGGSGYTVKWLVHTIAYQADYGADKRQIESAERVDGTFPALLDGDALIVDAGFGKISLKINNEIMEAGNQKLTKTK